MSQKTEKKLDLFDKRLYNTRIETKKYVKTMKFLAWLTEYPANSETANARAVLTAFGFGVILLIILLARA